MGKVKFFFRVGLPEGEVLIPGKYWKIPVWEVARHREDESVTLIRINAYGEFRFDFKHSNFAPTFDGCGLYREKDNVEEENPTHAPLLSKQGCRYDHSIHAIQGDIEKLLTDCRPIL